jgi:hypothetical protein
MWIGVSQAGHSFQEELPIFLVIFLLLTTTTRFIQLKKSLYTQPRHP